MNHWTRAPNTNDGGSALDGSLAPTQLEVGDPVSARPSRGGLGRAFGVILGMALAIGATYALPPLAPVRPWAPGSGYVPFWNVVGRELLGEEAVLEAEATRIRELRQKTELAATATAPVRERAPRPEIPVFPAYTPEARVSRPDFGIEPPEALDSYYKKLTLVDLGIDGAIARTGHWGDSVLGVDGITSGIRRRLQTRFGDAGHGFHLMDRYHPSYQQQGVQFLGGSGWNGCLIINECKRQDRRYGYGGYVVESEPWGAAASSFSTTKQGFGSRVSVFELWFARQPRGGKLEIAIDRSEKIVVDTSGEKLDDDFHMVYVQPGAHHFSVAALPGNRARAYGVVLENDGPGVVWDGIALIGGSTRGLRTQDPEHIQNQIRRRGLDLIAFMFGGNDLARKYVDLRESMQPYLDEYGEVIQRFRAGRPDASCLVISVIDHGERKADDSIVSRPFTKTLSDAQRDVAQKNGCGFFDTFEAMGGKGSAARWYRSNPRLMAPDLGHPTGSGHEVIAGLISNALLYGYEQYRDRMTGQPLPLPRPASPVPADGSETGAPGSGDAR